MRPLRQIACAPGRQRHARDVAGSIRDPDPDPGRSSRNICLVGTEPIELAGNFAAAGRGRRCQSTPACRRHRRAAGAFFGVQEESVRAEWQILAFVVIQEAGWDGFWIHRVLLGEGIERFRSRSRRAGVVPLRDLMRRDLSLPSLLRALFSGRVTKDACKA